MKVYLYYLLAVSLFCSCSSSQYLAQRDNAVNGAERFKSYRHSRFINDIEITPGSIVKSAHKPSTTKQVDEIEGSTTGTKKVPTATASLPNYTSNGNVAFALQMKYAEKLKVEPQEIANEQLYNTLEDWWATRYCFGGTSKSCVDCSGFTSNVYKTAFNQTLPRTAQSQYDNTMRVRKEELQEGDLVFFHTRNYSQVTHVGIYLRNNKFIHASTAAGVTISDLGEAYWTAKYYGAGRVSQ